MLIRSESYMAALLTLVLGATASLGGGGDGTPKAADGTPLIPRSVLFGTPDLGGVRISPDGSKLSYVAEVDGVANIWVAPIGKPEDAKPVTEDKNRGTRAYVWAYNSRYIAYLQDKHGDGNWHVHAKDLVTNESRDLTPVDGALARIQHTSPKFPNELLVTMNDRDPRVHDVHRVNVETGERSLVFRNTGFGGLMTDDDFNVALSWHVDADGTAEFYKRVTGGAWTPFWKISYEDARTTGAIGFDKTGKTLYMVDSTGRDTTVFAEYNLETDQKKVVASHPRADFDVAAFHPTERTVQAAAFTYLRREWKTFDDSIKGDFAYLKTVVDGELGIIDRSADDKHWLVGYGLDNGPTRFYHYDRAKKKADFLFSDRKELGSLPLAKLHPVAIKSRDGLDLVSYVALPVWADPDGDGRPKEALPMVLTVHGGPWTRNTWACSLTTQWLANRGYAVLSVNFRGSAGFGKDFVNAGNGEWGRKMQDDLIDAVNWAVKQKIAEPKRIAIMGVGYGGYATLAGLTFTPDVFACGVDICGISNLVTLLESIPPQYETTLERFVNCVGDHRSEEGKALLVERSPLTHAERIKSPLLIAHGDLNPQVKKDESEKIVETLQNKGVPVVYASFENEGQGLGQPENRKAFYAVTEAFLAKYLGGRYEPVGKDFEGSKIAVPQGVEHVPGLTEALSKGN